MPFLGSHLLKTEYRKQRHSISCGKVWLSLCKPLILPYKTAAWWARHNGIMKQLWQAAAAPRNSPPQSNLRELYGTVAASQF